MPTTITLDPVTRIEGHLEVQVTVDTVGGQQQVVEAHSAGKMFRGFEMILAGRDPRDAGLYTQRICGVCPVSHAIASCLALDDAFGVTPPGNGRILRNLIAAGNYLDSHVLHFYHLSALDFVDTSGILDMAPWTPRFSTPDMITGGTAATLVEHYVTALTLRRKMHQMIALFGGKMPCTGSIVVGGCTEHVSTEKIAAFRALLTEIRQFIDTVYVPDANLLAAQFPAYYSLGTGYGNLLSFGVFELNDSGSSKLFGAGRYVGGAPAAFDPAAITEEVLYSWYTPESGGANPAQGVTVPDAEKAGAYSWTKAPRYLDQPYEAGPLARLWINGLYTHGISMMDRTVARALETQMLANAMDGWLDQLEPGAPAYAISTTPANATGMGLTEAPRGALGHWLTVTDSVISRYQVITPTAWNASPRDDGGLRGPVEQALIGVPVADIQQPVEVLRVVHSFDPCLACAVHLVRADSRKPGVKILVPPAPR